MHEETQRRKMYENEKSIARLPHLYKLDIMGHQTVKYIFMAWFLQGTEGENPSFLMTAICSN